MTQKEPIVRMTVLVPESLHAALKEAAEADHRSISKEVIYAVERLIAERKQQRNTFTQPELPRT